MDFTNFSHNKVFIYIKMINKTLGKFVLPCYVDYFVNNLKTRMNVLNNEILIQFSNIMRYYKI